MENEQAGKLGNEKAAYDYARRDHLDPRDVQITRKAGEVELNVRRSVLGDRKLRDSGEGRHDGWLWREVRQ